MTSRYFIYQYTNQKAPLYEPNVNSLVNNTATKYGKSAKKCVIQTSYFQQRFKIVPSPSIYAKWEETKKLFCGSLLD